MFGAGGSGRIVTARERGVEKKREWMLASSCSDLHPPIPSLPRVVGGGECPASRDRPPIALATVNRIKIYRHRRCASQRKQFAFSPSYVFGRGGRGLSPSPASPNGA
ncbi:uncharacterized protein TNIN_485011 [Trichonephila inaurata madagascariensis]|uniref:Uncharacterized protein n=1 Tax=Trichonephila inaurata madagascariensis TaxID=2747483 RepID=A0A8X6XA23_9ARAC|nr:uncharacterized protein TNIN_485011 [Trichonephila inaurata madagascariensis]